MEVGSATSSLYGLQTANVQARSRQPEAQPSPQQPEQAPTTQQSQTAQTTQAVRAPAENEATERTRTEAEQPRPTVNANGQTVGTRVNTTA